MPTNAKIWISLVLVLSMGCGPTALRGQSAGPSLSLGGQASRRVETLTDLEEVRDVLVRDTGDVYVATDAGLFLHPADGMAPALVEGLPSDDVRGLVDDEGAVLVATSRGLARIADGQVTPLEGAPQIGHLTDMKEAADGTVWLCGLGGVARQAEGGGWEIFGDPVRCTGLAPTPEGQIWVGTTSGLWYVEGDVTREHPISGGMPEGYVRSVVPVLPGQIMALLQGPNDAQIGFWDGERWYGYTIRGLEGQAASLIRRGNDVLLISQDQVIAIAPRGEGVPLEPLSSTEGTVRSFRPAIQPAAEHQPGELPNPEVLEEPKRLADIPANRPTIQAPPFRARVLDVELPGRAYRALVRGPDAFLAIANQGVMQLPGDGRPPRFFRTRTLVPEEDMQIATDGAGTVWTISREGHLAKMVNGRLRRVRLPEGYVAQAVANGPAGAYLAALKPSVGPNTVQIFSNAGRGWTELAERTLEVPTELVGVPFMGVDQDGHVWLAIEIQRETGAGTRVRGAAVVDPGQEAVVYHHRGADREAGGLPLPDEISAVDFDTDNAWFASLSGLVRVGSSQAVTFGEARGVRGEVVTDAVVGSGIIWVAAAEGLGSYDRNEFSFAAQPELVQDARPTKLAMDLVGHLWIASPRGLILHEGEEWLMLDQDDGLPVTELRDVEVDGGGRVWLLAEDRVMLLSR